jgi:hypothetical protein
VPIRKREDDIPCPSVNEDRTPVWRVFRTA